MLEVLSLVPKLLHLLNLVPNLLHLGRDEREEHAPYQLVALPGGGRGERKSEERACY